MNKDIFAKLVAMTIYSLIAPIVAGGVFALFDPIAGREIVVYGIIGCLICTWVVFPIFGWCERRYN